MFVKDRSTGTLLYRATVNTAGYLEGAVYQITNGPLPNALKQFFERVEAPVPGREPLVLDAALAAKDIANERRREAQQPQRQTVLRIPDVLRRFGWTRETFDRARGSLGFPPGQSQVRDDGRGGVLSEPTWFTHDLDHWATTLQEIAGTTKR